MDGVDEGWGMVDGGMQGPKMDGADEGGIWMVFLRQYDIGGGMAVYDLVEQREEPTFLLKRLVEDI